MMRASTVVVGLVLLVVVGLVAGALRSPSADAQAAGGSCDELLSYYHSVAGQHHWYGAEEVEEEEEQAAEFPASGADDTIAGDSAAPADLGQRSETGTNVQVAGVDESDIVKTNGSEIFLLRDDALLVAAVGDDYTEVVGELRFERAAARYAATPVEMLLVGQRVFVFRSVQYEQEAGTQILEIDVSKRSRPRLLRTLDLYGGFVTGRLAGSSMSLVLRHDGSQSPALWDGDWRGWEQRVEASTLSTWLPIYSLTDHAAGDWRWGQAVDCDQVVVPEGASHPETTLVLTFDTERGLSRWGSAGAVGSTAAVYATAESVYVATVSDYRETLVHRFALSGESDPAYRGVATVRGQLINQFAMSEFGGHLRVATTRHDEWPTVSQLTVFDIDDEALSEVATLEGLGPSERIYAVRFLGGRGYVVTFRQIDPLYVLDLSNPEQPSVAGELKIPGFSAYLHPLSGGLLLGVGQEADPRTGQPLGLQVSLFDVSDPAEPTQLSRVALSAESRNAEFDHRAFSYYGGVAFVPTQLSRWGDGAELFALRVSAEGLELEATIDTRTTPLRSIPLGDNLYILTERDLGTIDLNSYEVLDWTAY